MKDMIEGIIFAILMAWFALTSFILFAPSSAVLMVGKHRHIVTVYIENNNTELQNELTQIVEKYTKGN